MADSFQKSKVKLICSVCGKGVGSGGSLTAWIFREQRCTCAPASARSIATIDENTGDAVDGRIEAYDYRQDTGDAQRDESTLSDRMVSGGDSSQKQDGDMVGNIIGGHYLILSRIGAGGMSVVYKARHIHLNKLVAIKFILPGIDINPQTIRRFQQEGRAATALNHPNIAKVSEFGIEAESHPYLVMDYVEGNTLAEMLGSVGAISPERAVSIVAQVCSGLEHAHAKGIIHRDIKPGNLIICSEGDSKDFAKILDFGIAKTTGAGDGNTANLTSTGDVFGSPTYMSPEQCMGKTPDPRTDIYSLGCVLYELIAGNPPFRGINVLETLNKHVSEEAPLLKGVPRQLQSIVSRALEKDPSHRFQSATEFKRVLDRFLAGADAGIVARLVGMSSLRKTGRKKKAMGFLGVVTFMLLVGLGVVAAASAILGYLIFSPAQHFDHIEQTSWIWQREMEPRRNWKPADEANYKSAIDYLRNFPDHITKSKLPAAQLQLDRFGELIETSRKDWERPVDTVPNDEPYFPTAQNYNDLQSELAAGEPTFRRWFKPSYNVTAGVNYADPEKDRILVLERVWAPVTELITQAMAKSQADSPEMTGRLHALLGDCFYHMNNFEKAANEYDQAVSMLKILPAAKDASTAAIIVRALMRQADSNYFLLKFAQAKSDYEEMLEAQTSETTLPRSDYELSCCRLADCCRILKDYDNAVMRYQYLRIRPNAWAKRDSISTNQALCSLYLAYIKSVAPGVNGLQKMDREQLTTNAVDDIGDAFGNVRYWGVLQHMMSNVYWNNGDPLTALLVRYTAFCVRWDMNLPSWDDLPLYKHIRPTSWETVTHRRKEELSPR